MILLDTHILVRWSIPGQAYCLRSWLTYIEQAH